MKVQNVYNKYKDFNENVPKKYTYTREEISVEYTYGESLLKGIVLMCTFYCRLRICVNSSSTARR